MFIANATGYRFILIAQTSSEERTPIRQCQERERERERERDWDEDISQGFNANGPKLRAPWYQRILVCSDSGLSFSRPLYLGSRLVRYHWWSETAGRRRSLTINRLIERAFYIILETITRSILSVLKGLSVLRRHWLLIAECRAN